MHDLPDHACFNHAAYVRRGVLRVLPRPHRPDGVVAQRSCCPGWCRAPQPDPHLRPLDQITNLADAARGRRLLEGRAVYGYDGSTRVPQHLPPLSGRADSPTPSRTTRTPFVPTPARRIPGCAHERLPDDATSASSGDDALPEAPDLVSCRSRRQVGSSDAPSERSRTSSAASSDGRLRPARPDRRRFSRSSAPAALAGASSCRWEKETIPHTKRPEETIPGKASTTPPSSTCSAPRVRSW